MIKSWYTVQSYWLCKGIIIQKQRNIESEHCWFRSVLCPPQASVTGAVLFSTAMQGLISLQLTPVGYVRRSTGKLENTMPSGAQVNGAWGHHQHFCRKTKCAAQWWNWSLIGLKGKHWAGVNVWYLHLWLNSITHLCGRKHANTRWGFKTDSQLCHFNSSWWGGNHLLMPKCSIPLCSGLNMGVWNSREKDREEIRLSIVYFILFRVWCSISH